MDGSAVHELPELVNLCLNCRRARCPGTCAAWREKNEELARAGKKRPGVRTKVYEMDGAWHTLYEWAQITGIPFSVLYDRVQKKKRPLRAAIEMGQAHLPGLFTVEGRTLSVNQWAEALGIHASTLRARKDQRGVSMEEAIAYYLVRGKRGGR